MDISTVLLVLAVLCGIWASATAVLLTRFLDQRGLRTHFPFIGLFLFRNLKQYREITGGETGRVGPLYSSYLASINAALLLVVARLALMSLGM